MEANTNFSHKIYKNNPLLFKSYIDKTVNITIEDNTTVSGTVYTVDPVSESIVLLQRSHGNRLKIIFGHAVKKIEVCSKESYKLPELFIDTRTNILQPTLENRKNAVIKLLQENRFTIKEEDNALTVENVLLIKPPYEPADCICANSIILGRIQSLLSREKTSYP